MEPYATYAQFTLTYSFKTLNEAEITSGWLPYGTQRVNEALGGWYTLPFSTNNVTARSLTIDFAALGILIRTRKETDSKELKEDLQERIASVTASGAPLMTDSAEAIYPSPDVQNLNSIYSSTKEYKPVFDLRDPEYQRPDPDQIREEFDEDNGYRWPYDF